MSNNYFALERNGKCLENVALAVEDNIVFEELMAMSYEEMKEYPYIEQFVVDIVEATNDLGGTQLIVNLAGPDDVFIWGIVIGIYGDDYNFAFVDWKKDGKNYRYEKN